jgi:hypothetical protein
VAGRVLLFLSVAVLLALLYDGGIFYSRWSYARRAEQERAEKEARDARRTIDRMGGSQLKILGFFAQPPVIRPGGEALLCYNVVNAKTLRMEPPAGDVYPALSHCLQVSPRRTTEYKLFAEDGAGHAVSETFTLQVKP